MKTTHRSAHTWYTSCYQPNMSGDGNFTPRHTASWQMPGRQNRRHGVKIPFSGNTPGYNIENLYQVYPFGYFFPYTFSVLASRRANPQQPSENSAARHIPRAKKTLLHTYIPVLVKGGGGQSQDQIAVSCRAEL